MQKISQNVENEIIYKMSKTYNVYGIGNALVDIVTEVDDKFLQDNNIEKGLMTLVDEENQTKISNAIDMNNSNMQCGGSAANSIIAVSQFGGSSYYSCKVANDELGEFYKTDLSSNGVDSNLQSEALEAGITGKCLVMTTEDASRTMNTFLGITESYSKSEIKEAALKNSEYLYMEGYLVTSENGQEAMKHAKKLAEDSGVKTALTFSDPAMVKYFKEPMVSVVGGKVWICSSAMKKKQCCIRAKTVYQKRQESVKERSAKKFVITLGEKGAIVFDGEAFIDIEPNKVQTRLIQTELAIYLLEHLCMESQMAKALLNPES